MARAKQERERRVTDRCLSCGRFVGIYPQNFYADRFCGACYFDALDDDPPRHFMPGEDGYARQMAWEAGNRG